MKDKRFRVKGIKDGSYYLAEVQAQYEHERGDGVVIPAGTTYYLHLQYPTLREAMQQLSRVLNCGERIISITTTTKAAQTRDNFMLAPYLGNANYTRVWHYKIFRRLGIRV